ncbi:MULTISPECIES: ABC transporter ATP-binding protein [unclassified Breznakia]|uniref:ABC transporter ATP-binding protein n=1 Tax=unclassified Breznakia TaxID=2623764 RepID=UPI002476446A|nr:MULTISPECIES: ABC transporter ATP-binding protein [unclassified Breznakia]MDH6365889.1 ABC-2 type transport system ATP-binding protein [Breznakia sp. PH1-1]MDH6403179.1 ABC-2 type transport system ATP-binding protein [Breznakia sp. PF1-11]MDH6410888.1 ABC-2 type transport system ATP-binding protein [Breznakia sp. PFB1-11]MDH6413055.1 ABC-2 type transport system ATP-binding protein [Breznakia sp. PFB1-14]MDH6415423.1 ABC-2 type transport system ATP-binding protein [Breznakia sp. PFB1-4]
MESLIKVENVSKRYGKRIGLDDVSFSIQPGEIIGILGPNGSGKTTLMKILNTLIADYDGKILVDGQPLGVHSKEVISFLPDEPYFEKGQRGIDVLNMFVDLYKDFDYNRCIQLLSKFDIDSHLYFRQMSKGMKEKFLLSLVMSRRAKIIMLDEPIGGVDPVARDVILDTILENYDENQTLIVSTHLISDVERIFNRVIFLKEGAIALDQDVDDIRIHQRKSIEEMFKEVYAK